jgi:small-conductance mechanosensitive channel
MSAPLRPSLLVIAKLIIALLLLGIVASLFTSAFFLVKDDSKRKRTLTLLKLRVALSVTLIIFVLAAYGLGWIQPHGPQP